MHPTATFERALARRGLRSVAGVDEVGRGCWAGPVVAAACVLDLRHVPRGIDDSKRLPPVQRERLARELRRCAVAWAVASVPARTIDRIGIVAATQRAMVRAVRRLAVPADALLVDALELPGLDLPQRALVHGDRRSLSIAAASILAKVWRDAWMRRAGKRLPSYGFERHVGYGTAEHRVALAALGPCALHRRSFRPVSLPVDN